MIWFSLPFFFRASGEDVRYIDLNSVLHETLSARGGSAKEDGGRGTGGGVEPDRSGLSFPCGPCVVI